MGLFNKNQDEDISELADLLFHDEEDFVVNQIFFESFPGDYSLESVQVLQDYLVKVNPDTAGEDELFMTVIKCGAYLGEVIRRRSDRGYHWYDYDTAVKKNQRLKDQESSMDNDILLYSDELNRYLFPCEIVHETLGKKKPRSLYTWAQDRSRTRKESQELARSLRIDCDADSIQINGKPLPLPCMVSDLEKILGANSEWELDMFYHLVWDDWGISVWPSHGMEMNSIGVQIRRHSGNRLAPVQDFQGTVFVQGKPYTQEAIPLNKYMISPWTKGDGQGFNIHLNPAYREPLAETYYQIPVLKEEVLNFTDFGFKLCIIQELMYNKSLLKPKFDLDQFVQWYQGRKIDLKKEGHGLIPEAVQYFKDLPIPKRLAEKVTSIYQDGGNEIYLNLLNHGTGEEHFFDIASAAAAPQFPKLRKAELVNCQAGVLEDLKKLGIKAQAL